MNIHSLKFKILFALVGSILLTTISFMSLVKIKIDQTIQEAHDKNAINLLNTIYLSVGNEYQSILFHRQSSLEHRKQELQNTIDLMFTIVDRYYQKAQRGELSKQAAQRMAAAEIKQFRYDDGIGYIWINDITRPIPRMIMHPTIPELDTKILDNPEYNNALGKGRNLFAAFVDVCLEKGEGYVDYLWPKPMGGGLTEQQPKLSYVRLFKGWNWVVGTGVYIDDIEKDRKKRLAAVKKELRYSLAKIRIADTGYVYVFDSNYRIIVHPNFPADTNIGTLINLKTGKALLPELVSASKTPELAYEYIWDKPNSPGDYKHRKKAYIRYFEPLDWYIASSVYLDEIEEPADTLVRELIMIAVFFLIMAFILSYFLSKNLSAPLGKLLHAANIIEHKGIESADIPICGSLETKQLGATLAHMIQSIQESTLALHKEMNLNRQLLKHSPALIVGINLEGKAVLINDTMLETLGYQPGELNDVDYIKTFIPEEERQSLTGIFTDLVHQDTFTQNENHVLTKSGEKRLVEWHGSSLNDLEGNIEMLFGIGIDITERKKDEQEMIRLRSLLDNIVNSMPSVLIGVDIDGKVIQWNTAAEKHTGISEEKAKGANIYKVYPELIDEKENIEKAIQQASVIKKKKTLICEVHGKSYSDLTYYPLASNGVAGAVIRIDDITDRVRMEEMMVQNEKMMSLGGLAAGMAHEINNPLAGILQNIQVIERRVNPDLKKNRKIAEECGFSMDAVEQFVERQKLHTMLAATRSSGVRAAEIVQNMLSFSRNSEEGMKLEAPERLLNDSLELAGKDYDLNNKYDFRKVKIIQDYDVNIPDIPCEGSKIKQVFLNLLKNGAQAMFEHQQDKGHVQKPSFTIRLKDDDNMVKFEFQDNGPGIEDKHLKRIFEPFFTTKANGTGTGLGLSVSYFIITENHKGSLSVESTHGIGTNFIIRLPKEN